MFGEISYYEYEQRTVACNNQICDIYFCNHESPLDYICLLFSLLVSLNLLYFFSPFTKEKLI